MKTKSENTAPRGGKGKGEGKRERAEKRRGRRKEGRGEAEGMGFAPKAQSSSPHRPCSAAPPSPALLHRPHTTKFPRPD